MSTFLGPVGSIIPVKCASSLTSTGGRDVSFTRTLGKRKAFLGRVRAREWQVDIGLAKPSELSGLRWLAENVNAPMVWYSPDAVVGNILSPDQADLVPESHTGLEGPLVETEPGVWVKSAMNSGNYLYLNYVGGSLDPVPVVPGVPVTVSAFLRGGTISSQRIRMAWRDIAGNVLERVDADFEVTASWARRSAVFTPPLGACLLSLEVAAAQVAGPAVSLTEQLMPYSSGRGAYKVVAHGLSDAVIRATEDQQLQSLSFTVSEVG